MPVLMELLSGAIAARYKVLRPNVASGVDSARFLGEIQTAARLHHSPILPLIIRTRPTVDLLRIE